MRKWLVFSKERFHPPSYLAMIGFFVWVHGVLVGTGISWLHYVLVSVGVTAFFYKLRLYDEIKDYEIDLQINPTRPLARGLVNHQDLHRGIFVCLLVELLAFAFLGWPAFAAMGLAVGYSLIMYNEFFLKEIIRPHLTTYAIIHTVSCAFLSLAMFSGLRGMLPWDLPLDDLRFSAACWCIFNVFEFARKTFAGVEERDDVESYSKVWSPYGSVALVLVMVGVADFFLLTMEVHDNAIARGFYGALTAIVAVVGVIYAFSNSAKTANLYRVIASLYIMTSMAGVIIVDFLK